MRDQQIVISIDAAAASDSWGFVGRLMIADYECYRTLQAYPTPGDALAATQAIVGDAIGGLLAGEEWRQIRAELGHAPQRTELNLGLSGAGRRQPLDEPVTPD